MRPIVVMVALALSAGWAQAQPQPKATPKVVLKTGEKAVIKIGETKLGKVETKTETPAKAPAAKAPVAVKAAPASAPASAPAVPVPAPVDPSVKQPKTPAEAVDAARDAVGGLKARRWWGAAAGGIFLVLFICGLLGLWARIGTFWAWVTVGVLSLAAGFFAAFDKTGFNWNTFYGYLTAGPTVAWLRDFFKDVVQEKFKAWRQTKKPSGEVSTPPSV